MQKDKKPMSSRTADLREAVRIIADNMISLRPRSEVEYIARRYAEYITDLSPLGARCVDLYKLFPDAKHGDWAYVGVELSSKDEFDAALVCEGAEEIYIDGEKFQGDKISFRMKAGMVKVEFKCVAGESFGVRFTPSVSYYPGMLAKDYLHHVKIMCPAEGFFAEEGAAVSELCGERGSYEYPKAPAAGNSVNFFEIYPEEQGVYAYALMYAKEKGSVKFDFHSAAKAFVNGKAVFTADCGEKLLTVNKDDCILIKCERSDAWGFEYEGDFCLPFLKKTRTVGDDIAVIGTFGLERAMDLEYGPELYMDFKTPYHNYKNKACFFKLASCDDYITADIDTCFYAQWFYALMVGEYGLLDAARLTGAQEYLRYFVDSLSTAADYYELQLWQKSVFGESAFLQRAMHPYDLDGIGAAGMNMCELYAMTGNANAAMVAERLIRSIDIIPRFDDGTFHRVQTMWADDIYMSCPFMLRYGLMFDDRRWLLECVRQILGFKNKLFMDDKGIFSHIYFVQDRIANQIPWGRGNGWIFITLSELLEKLPPDIDGIVELRELYLSFANGIMQVQGENGLWHQVLDRCTSYEETSCTGMFVIGLCRGVRLGLLADEAREAVDKAIKGLFDNKIDTEGNVYDVCRGSSCSMDAEYYMQLGTIDNDDHGTGIILSALYEADRIK